MEKVLTHSPGTPEVFKKILFQATKYKVEYLDEDLQLISILNTHTEVPFT